MKPLLQIRLPADSLVLAGGSTPKGIVEASDGIVLPSFDGHAAESEPSAHEQAVSLDTHPLSSGACH